MPEPCKRFATSERGFRTLRRVGNVPRPRRGLRHSPREQKGRDTHGFPSSLNSYLSFEGLGANGRLRKQEKEYGRGFFLPCLSQPIRSVGYRTATQVGYFQQARHTRAAQLVSLEVTDSTYESIYLVAFILAGPVHHNALTNCAAQLSSRGPSLALWAIHLVPHSALINPHV